jgi:hypothetical protein
MLQILLFQINRTKLSKKDALDLSTRIIKLMHKVKLQSYSSQSAIDSLRMGKLALSQYKEEMSKKSKEQIKKIGVDTMFLDNLISNIESFKNNFLGNVVLLSKQLNKVDGQNYNISGRVKNAGNVTVKAVRIVLTVREDNGRLVATDSVYADSTTLEPNQETSFDNLLMKDHPDTIEYYELSLYWEAPDETQQYVNTSVIGDEYGNDI